MRKSWWVSLVASLALLAVPASVFADVNDFTVTNFKADYYLSKADPQGQLRIDEQITVNFTDQNHGILRAIPDKYNGQTQHVTVTNVQRDGTNEPYSTYRSNDNEVLKIGNGDQTITGEHLYRIQYTVQNVIRFTSGHDEFIWNTNGTQWSQPFLAESATLHLENDVKASLGELSCFTGQQGSKGHNCIVNGEERSAIFTTTTPLQAGETMTFMTDFPAGTFHKPTAVDWWHDHYGQILWLVIPSLIAFAIAYPYWFKNGKDVRGRGTIVPEYAPPADLRAAEGDTVLHYKLSQKAISATIIDLAIRKYLRIVEGESEGVLGLGKHKTYTFQRLPAPQGDTLKPYESKVLNGLFPNGDSTEMNDLKDGFYKVRRDVEKDIPKSLTQAGYFAKNPRSMGGGLHIAGIVVIVIGVALGGPNIFTRIGIIAAGVVLLGFGILMPKRTQQGADAKDALEGLKLYMDTAEKDRLQMLQSVDAPYAQRSAEPVKTVELFEKLLPYAIVLGVETSWAKQFESIYTTPPDWYQGNWTSFNTGYLVGSLNSSVSAMNTSFAAPASSGSGGGGGFSGGGGGGGGGGGW